jgi:hypothetical protein
LPLLLLLQELPLLDAGYYGNNNQLDGQLYDLSSYAGKDFQVWPRCCCWLLPLLLLLCIGMRQSRKCDWLVL